jgi:hypothetical protein
VIAQVEPRSPHDLLQPLLPRLQLEGWRRKLSDRIEDFRRLPPQPFERLRRFAAAAQRARIDRHAIRRLRERCRRCFGLLLAGDIETRIGIFAPAGGWASVPD